MKSLIVMFLILVAAASALSGEKPSCILPVPDGQGPTPSKASFDGEIARVTSNFIMVRTKPNTQPTKIRINEKTQIFTVYGGYVDREQLDQGQQVHVWYVGCGIKKTDTLPLAAVVQLESR